MSDSKIPVDIDKDDVKEVRTSDVLLGSALIGFGIFYTYMAFKSGSDSQPIEKMRGATKDALKVFLI